MDKENVFIFGSIIIGIMLLAMIMTLEHLGMFHGAWGISMVIATLVWVLGGQVIGWKIISKEILTHKIGSEEE